MFQTRALVQKVQPGGTGGIDSPAPVAYRSGGKFEYSTVQIDPYLQGAAPLGGDAFAGNVSTGIIIPPTISTNTSGRYLCLLAYASFQQGRRVRLVGLRQYLSIGASQTVDGAVTYFEKQITSPLWRFPDGNVSWHVMALPPNTQRPAFLAGLPAGVSGNVGNQIPGNAFVNARTPAILSLSSSTDGVGAYMPPNGGRPYGHPLTADLGNIHDVRFPWDSANAWHYSVDVPINPPCDVALYASVKQTSTAARTVPAVPPSPVAGAPAAGFSTLSPEDQFFLTFPATAVYWRVAGALVFAENEDRDQ